MAPPELPGSLQLVHTPRRAPLAAQTPREAQRRFLKGSPRTWTLLFKTGAAFELVEEEPGHEGRKGEGEELPQKWKAHGSSIA